MSQHNINRSHRILTGVDRILTGVKRILTGVNRILIGVNTILTGVKQTINRSQKNINRSQMLKTGVFGNVVVVRPSILLVCYGSTRNHCYDKTARKIRQQILTEVNLSQAEEPAKAGTCACHRHALQQLALNVHIKHSDLT